MSVAAALAEAHHHSAPKVGAETHDALRRQKTASAGARPGVLKDPAPQGAVTVGYVAAPGPLLSTPLLADTAAEAVDARTVKYLLHAALNEKKEEEKEERRKAKEARRLEVTALLAVPLALRTQAQQRRLMELSDEVDSETHPKRRKRKKRKKRKLPRAPLPRCGRPCDHRQVPALQVVHVREGAPASVHRQSGRHSCYACRDVYPQCELCSSLWKFFRCSSRAVPPPDIGGVGFGSSPYLDTIHTIYELCLPSERGCPFGICVAMSCGGGGFSPDGAYDSAWYSVRPRTGKYFVNYFQYQEFVECICMLNFCFSSNDEICADNYIFPLFMLKDMCRSVKWELYLYGDMTIKVDRDSVEVLPWGVPPPWFFTQLGNGSHTIHVLCLPSERGMGMSIFLADPVSSGKYSGTSCRDVLHATLTGSTIDATAAVGTTCTVSADCTVSATPMCSSGACVALSCDGGSSSDGAYDSLWGALPMKGITPSLTSSTKRTLGASACSMTGSASTTEFAPTTTTASSSS